ncbi:unnamed protein product [Pelagomonas calceolata]|uniref:(R)-citramalate synthase n=2 Tax=Pelagomonas calceolata TaxID=35677 RepID=A0A8J2WZL5_9STRA|nr:unnamed protein product [Pelagomonas calceolata]
MRGLLLATTAAALAPTPRRIFVYDTTLRDGTQGEAVSCSVDDKLKIASKLAAFGVDYLECGWPGSNPKDAEFFTRAKTELSSEAKQKLVAFGSTRSKRSATADQDPQLRALVESGAPTACIVCKASSWQTTDILGASREDNLDMISSSVEFLRQEGLKVHVDLEHFYDGFLGGRAADGDEAYSLECARVAVEAGAEAVVLCDTNGGHLPWDVERATAAVVDAVPSNIVVGVHAHDDSGVAVANSLAAVRGGASLVQGTANGVGERTGNANLNAIIGALALKGTQIAPEGIDVACSSNLHLLADSARFVDETLNLIPRKSQPYVGASAFAHKGGLHVSALAKNAKAYEHVDPARVGNEQRVLVSELSGRANIWSTLKKAGLVREHEDATDLGQAKWRERSAAILERVKRLENLGYSFEGAEASVHLMLLHASPGYCSPFTVLDYSVTTSDENLDSASRAVAKGGRRTAQRARATVKVRIADGDDEDRLDVAEGSGPVDALAAALVRSLAPTFPFVDSIRLVDYKVRILDPHSATRAATRVECTFKEKITGKVWTTVSVDRNVISASANALVDGFEFGIVEYADSCMLCEVDYDAPPIYSSDDEASSSVQAMPREVRTAR